MNTDNYNGTIPSYTDHEFIEMLTHKAINRMTKETMKRQWAGFEVKK